MTRFKFLRAKIKPFQMAAFYFFVLTCSSCGFIYEELKDLTSNLDHRIVVTITAQPSDPSSSATATFSFIATSTAGGSITFRCRVDSGSYVSCNSGTIQYSLLSTGSHTFQVIGIDSTGVESAAVSYSWTITTPAVLGDSDPNAITRVKYGMNQPYQLHSCGTRLFVADATNSRILIWNTLPTSSRVAPDVILGQPDSSTWGVNTGGASAKTLNGVSGVFCDGTKLYAADQENSRVLIWNTIPTSNFTAADVVLGQADFTSNSANAGGAVSNRSLNCPLGVTSDGTKLAVADSLNHRILIWNSIPTTDYAVADTVVGQPDMTSNSSNAGGGVTPSDRSLRNPAQIQIHGNRLYVADSSNGRILIWNTVPTTDYASANLVVGQADFTTVPTCASATAGTFCNVKGVYTDGTRLIVGDYQNNRVLVYSSLPTVNSASADLVYGQPDFTSNLPNAGSTTSQTMYRVYGVFADTNQIYTTDYFNHRILRF